MVQPNAPRFLREAIDGLSAKVVNMTEKENDRHCSSNCSMPHQ